MRPFLNVGQLADWLGNSSKSFVYKLVRQGKIPFHKLGDSPNAKLVFDPEEVAQALGLTNNSTKPG